MTDYTGNGRREDFKDDASGKVMHPLALCTALNLRNKQLLAENAKLRAVAEAAKKFIKDFERSYVADLEPNFVKFLEKALRAAGMMEGK